VLGISLRFLEHASHALLFRTWVVVVGGLRRLLDCWGLSPGDSMCDARATSSGGCSSSDVGSDCLVLLVVLFVCII